MSRAQWKIVAVALAVTSVASVGRPGAPPGDEVGPGSRITGSVSVESRYLPGPRFSLNARSDSASARSRLQSRIGRWPDHPCDSLDVAADSVFLSADLLSPVMEGETLVRRLVGNVRLCQGDTRLWSESAAEYGDRDELLFTGDVLVVESGDTISADRLLYNEQTGVARMTGNVVMTDGEVLVSAPKADYYTDEKRTDFFEGLTLVDSTTVLRAKEGVYWSDEQVARFYNDVLLEDDSTTAWSDSLRYDRGLETTEASGRVVLRTLTEEVGADSATIAWVLGDWALSNSRLHEQSVRGNALLIRLAPDSTGKTDTLAVRAETLTSSKTDSLERMIATKGVRLWKSDLGALADSMVYDRLPGSSRFETIRLFAGPIAWFGDYQISGDTVVARSAGGTLDSIRVRSSVFLAGLDSLLQRIHQVKGQHLVGSFREDGRRTMTVWPNAEAIYYLKDKDEPGGAVRTSADRIVFRLRGDSIERISVESGVEGTFLPEELVEEPLRLDGFVWSPERRPAPDEFFGDERLVTVLETARTAPFENLAPEAPVPATATTQDTTAADKTNGSR